MSPFLPLQFTYLCCSLSHCTRPLKRKNSLITFQIGSWRASSLKVIVSRRWKKWFLKATRSICHGWLCCDVGNDHLGVDAFFGSYFDDDNSHFDLNRVPFEPKKERFLQIILRLVELLLVCTLFSIVSPTLFLLAGITHEVTNFTYNVFSQKEPKKKQKMTLWLWSSMDSNKFWRLFVAYFFNCLFSLIYEKVFSWKVKTLQIKEGISRNY